LSFNVLSSRAPQTFADFKSHRHFVFGRVEGVKEKLVKPALLTVRILSYKFEETMQVRQRSAYGRARDTPPIDGIQAIGHVGAATIRRMDHLSFVQANAPPLDIEQRRRDIGKSLGSPQDHRVVKRKDVGQLFVENVICRDANVQLSQISWLYEKVSDARVKEDLELFVVEVFFDFVYPLFGDDGWRHNESAC
jgi:hypothetical protein